MLAKYGFTDKSVRPTAARVLSPGGVLGKPARERDGGMVYSEC